MNCLKAGGRFRPTQRARGLCVQSSSLHHGQRRRCACSTAAMLQKRIMSVSKCCRRKGRRVIKNKRVRCLWEHMCSPNFMATSFFTLKFILCANVTFEPEGDTHAPAEHWGNGSWQDFLIAQREFFIKRLQTNDEKRLMRCSTEGFIWKAAECGLAQQWEQYGKYWYSYSAMIDRQLKNQSTWPLMPLNPVARGGNNMKKTSVLSLQFASESRWNNASPPVGPTHL